MEADRNIWFLRIVCAHKTAFLRLAITYVSFEKINAWCAFICVFRDLWENNIGLASFCWLLLLHLRLAFCFLRYSDIEDTKTDKTDKTDTKSRKVLFSSFSSVLLITADREITKKSFHAYLCTHTIGLNA